MSMYDWEIHSPFTMVVSGLFYLFLDSGAFTAVFLIHDTTPSNQIFFLKYHCTHQSHNKHWAYQRTNEIQ